MSKILVVDDNAEIRETLSAALAEYGHVVTPASGGREGTRILSKNPIDIVITDIVMDNGDGIEIIANIRSADSEMPIIAMSGGGRLPADFYREMAEKLGADLFLRKPFRIERLAAAVSKLCRATAKAIKKRDAGEG